MTNIFKKHVWNPLHPKLESNSRCSLYILWFSMSFSESTKKKWLDQVDNCNIDIQNMISWVNIVKRMCMRKRMRTCLRMLRKQHMENGEGRDLHRSSLIESLIMLSRISALACRIHVGPSGSWTRSRVFGEPNSPKLAAFPTGAALDGFRNRPCRLVLVFFPDATGNRMSSE